MLRPPKDFRPAERILSATFSRDLPPVARGAPRVRRGALAVGLRYDRRASAYCEANFEGYVGHPWIHFRTRDEGLRWAQPDGILLDLRQGRITLLEFKIKHSILAWWQLRHLYEPLLRFIFGSHNWSYSCCEIVRWHDPAIALPETPAFVESPRALRPGEYGIMLCDPSETGADRGLPAVLPLPCREASALLHTEARG